MSKVSSKLMLCAALSALLVAGCKKKEAGAPASATAPTTAAAPAPRPAAPADAPIVRATVGVAECDEWLKKVEACMAKDPAIKASYMPGYKMMNVAWPKNFAAGGATRAALAPGCKTSLETLDPKCR